MPDKQKQWRFSKVFYKRCKKCKEAKLETQMVAVKMDTIARNSSFSDSDSSHSEKIILIGNAESFPKNSKANIKQERVQKPKNRR